MIRRPTRWWPLYAAWIALCAILFLLLSGMEDPSRPKGRILSLEAGDRALAVLRLRDRQRYAGYEVVHVAHATRREGSGGDRWIVLLDRVPHTALREAVIVELDAGSGKLLGVRRPD